MWSTTTIRIHGYATSYFKGDGRTHEIATDRFREMHDVAVVLCLAPLDFYSCIFYFFHVLLCLLSFIMFSLWFQTFTFNLI